MSPIRAPSPPGPEGPPRPPGVHPAPRSHPLNRTRSAIVLAVCPAPLWPQSNGYALRVGNLLSELSRSWRIVLVGQPSPPEHDRTAEVGLDEFVPVDLGGRIATMPWQLETAPLRAAALQVARRIRPSAALLWSGSEFLAFSGDFAVTIADRIDSATLSNWRNLRAPASWADRYQAVREAVKAAWYERKVVRSVAATLVVGDADAAVLRWISGRHSVHVVPNGVALQPAGALPRESPTPTVAFTGVLSFEPNVAAAQFFADAIWPLVRQAVPEARFVIAGRDPTPAVEALGNRPGIHVLANLAAMDPVLSDAWVAVAPMRSGSGIKNKVLEAWSCKRPVVMSELATNGLTMDAETRTLVADAPAAFAERVIRLLEDPEERLRLGRASYSLAVAHHTWRRSADAISELLDHHLGRARPSAC